MNTNIHLTDEDLGVMSMEGWFHTFQTSGIGTSTSNAAQFHTKDAYFAERDATPL